MLIHTKTGMLGGPGALAPDRTRAALDASLARLRTDYVDLFYAHRDDTGTPLAEIAKGLGALVDAGRVRELGASNFTAPRLEAAIAAARSVGAPAYSVLQNQYHLLERSEHPPEMVALAEREGVVFLPYYALAASFLTGKYRRPEDWRGTARAARLDSFAQRGFPMLEVMDRIVVDTGASHAQIALAWLNAQPGVAAPIASATSVAQLEELVAGARLELSPEHIARLDAA
jgi:aryl-alcohol dehydrogenase-like predicted oxidoreductase